MSGHVHDRAAHEIEQLRARAQSLRHILKHQAERARQRHRALLVAGLLLMTGSLAALGNLTRLTFALDARAVTELGRSEVERSLPVGRRAIQSFLEGEAPRLATSILGQAVEFVPRLRALLVEELGSWVQTFTSELEVQLRAQLDENLRGSRAELEAELPGLNDRQRVSFLVQKVIRKFGSQARTIVKEMQPEYAAELERVVEATERLRVTPEDALTHKERLQRDIIRTILQLSAEARAP